MFNARVSLEIFYSLLWARILHNDAMHRAEGLRFIDHEVFVHSTVPNLEVFSPKKGVNKTNGILLYFRGIFMEFLTKDKLFFMNKNKDKNIGMA